MSPPAAEACHAGWWRQPCGPRDVLALALPLVASTASLTVMLFCDRLFLAWWSPDAVAASLGAGVLYWTVFSFPMGVASYAATFVAQYEGAGRPQRVGPLLGQALRVGVYAGPLFLLLGPAAPLLFRSFGHAETLVWEESLYLAALSFGMGPSVIASALAAYFIGRGQTRVVMVVDIATAGANVVLDYWWIFGGLGLAPGGIEGAGWATTAAQGLRVVAFAAAMLRSQDAARYRLGELFRFDPRLMLRLWRFGAPAGLHAFVEGLAITFFCLAMGRFGSLAAGATNVAFSVNMVAFVPMIGMGMAVSTLVGQQLGRDRPDLAARATWTGLSLSLLYTGGFAGLYAFAPDLLLWSFRDAPNFAELRDVSVVLLRFVAAYCLLDAAQLIFVNAIRGAGDTLFVLATTLSSGAAFVAAGFGLEAATGGGLYAWWLAVTGWIWLLATAFGLRFLSGRWKNLRVIEPEADPAEEEAVGQEEIGGEAALAAAREG